MSARIDRWLNPIWRDPLPQLVRAGDASAIRIGLDPRVVAEMAIRTPTLRQMMVLKIIADETRDEGAALTYRRLQDLLKSRSIRTVSEHVHSLRRRRLVAAVQEPGQLAARRGSMKVTEAGLRILAAWTPPDGLEGLRVA